MFDLQDSIFPRRDTIVLRHILALPFHAISVSIRRQRGNVLAILHADNCYSRSGASG